MKLVFNWQKFASFPIENKKIYNKKFYSRGKNPVDWLKNVILIMFWVSMFFFTLYFFIE